MWATNSRTPLASPRWPPHVAYTGRLPKRPPRHAGAVGSQPRSPTCQLDKSRPARTHTWADKLETTRGRLPARIGRHTWHSDPAPGRPLQAAGALGRWPRCPSHQIDKSRPSSLPPSGQAPSSRGIHRKRASRTAHLRIRTSRSHTVRGVQAPGRNVPGGGPAPTLAACQASQVGKKSLAAIHGQAIHGRVQSSPAIHRRLAGTHRPYMANHHKLHGHSVVDRPCISNSPAIHG